jgi:S-ribosylhomocysteine lyase
MEKITSFTVDHRYITEGIYISRIDGDITTYDMRTRKPNCGKFMDDKIMHTFEHLFATYIRNSKISDRVIYFGPMGCATGFYLLVRNSDHEETLLEIKSVLKKIISHKGEVFGASEIECGNYKTLNLESAVKEAKKYLEVLNSKEDIDFKYPIGEN